MIDVAEPGNVRILSCLLTNNSRGFRVNPLDQILGIDIYEDITKPSIYATIAINDNIDLLHKFPLLGEETFTIEFMTPGMTRPAKYELRAYAISNVEREPNGKGVRYMIKCCSPEHIENTIQVVNQTHTDTIDRMVRYIGAQPQYLNSKKNIVIDPTKGIQTIVFTNLAPFESIDLIRQRAVSKDYPTSSYVFFENQAGYYFKTIEGLIKDSRPTIGSREFNAIQDTTANPEIVAKSFRTIQRYERIKGLDVADRAQEGMYKAVTQTFDLATKTFSQSNFNVNDIYKQIQKPDMSKMIPNLPETIDKIGKGKSKIFFVPKDSNAPDNFIDVSMAARNSFNTMMNGDVTRVMVYGDSGLKAGDMVTLNLPEPSGMTGSKKADKNATGNYLIIRLRHLITPSMRTRHDVVFDAVKMGF